MAADPYQTLGVARGADEKAIKSAYRKLAKELHPDRNQDNPKAAERFSSVTSAYDLLSDKDKRARFDRGEIDGDGNPRAPFGFGDGGGASGGGNPFGGGGNPFAGGRGGGFRAGGGPGGAGGFEDGTDFGDIFDNLFNSARGGGAGGGGNTFGSARRGPPPRAKGADTSYRLAVSFEDAAALRPQRVTLGNGKTIEIKLDPGVETGTQRRLAGQGESGPTGPGDAIVTIDVQPHRFFLREGDNIRLDLPVRLDEAVLGGRVKVPTVDGPVMVAVPKGSSSGKILRLGGKGFHKEGGGRGDQLVTLVVDLPAADEALERFAEGWTSDRDRNPRTALGV